MTTSPTHHRQIPALALTIAAWLTLTPGGAFSSEPIQPTASMAVARRGHTATVLADGRVLIVGGLDASGPLAAAEVFDPAQKTFSLAGNLVNARYGHTATLLTNGRVLIAGGQDASGAVPSAEIFDPADTNGFRLLPATMGAARAGHTATVRSDGTVLLAGGDTAGTAEIFDPATESFYTPLLPMASPRSGHTATPLADDNLFLVGGGTASIELFNAASNSFSLWPNGLSQIRSGHSSIPTPDGKLLVIGGDPSGTFETFDPTAGSSLLSLSLGTPSTTANLLANNQILVLGPGVSGLFDETTTQLSPLVDTNASLLQLSGHTATELPTANKQILVAGGIDNSNNLLSSATLYNPASISTDAGDYPPFSWVNIYGSGFLPNETVTNQVEEIVGPAAGTNYAPWGVVADTNGAFATTWQVFSEDLLDTTLKLTAVGQTSGLKAEATFTDAGGANSGDGTMIVSPTTATASSTGNSFTFTFNISASGNNGNYAANSYATVIIPAGWTAPQTTSSGSAGFVSATALAGATVGTVTVSGSGPWTITVPFTTPNGGASWTLTYAGGGAKVTAPVTTGTYTFTTATHEGAGTPPVNIGSSPTVAVTKTSSTGVSSSANPSTYGQSISFTATVAGTGGTPTGTIQFQTNGVNFGSAVAMSGGSATSTSVSTLGAGNVAVTAIYSGDSNFATSTGTLSGGQTINKATLTVTPNAVSTTYNATTLNNTTYSDNAANYSITGFQNGQNAATAGLTFSGSMSFNGSTATTVRNVGTYSLAAGTLTLTANNYVMSFSNPTPNNYVITGRAITITAATNTKTYDGTTSAATTPTVTSGALQGTDTGSFTETYDTRNAGTGKTLTPSGTVNDGNGGNNYTITFANNITGVINARALTVTAATNTKTYDGTTSAAATPTVTSGAIQTGDTANFTEAYTSKNAGNGKTLTPSGTVTDGNGGANYTVTFVNNNTGVINALALTVTAATNTKTYDGTTSAAATPTVTSGAVQPGDTANFTEAYNNKNVGTGKPLTPSGTVTDGNGGANYAVSFVNNTTGVISAMALTVTAATNTKTYDGTTSAAATPTITSGAVQTGDTANFTETYDTKNVGTAKTLTPAGTVTDGNGGANYAVSFVNNTTGVINARALTITAVTNTKTYDATTSAGATPTVTSGVVQTGDTANFIETYDSKNEGTGKTLTPSGTVTDGNSGNNYTYNFVSVATGGINKRALTITAAADTKVYDATTSAATAPTITSGVLQATDTANFIETYSSKNVGTNKPLTPSGTVSDGNSGNNYSYTFTPANVGTITARALTVTAQTNTKVYDGTTSATATPMITSGVLQDADTANFTEVYSSKTVNSGKTLIPSGTVNDGNGGNNYSYTFINDTTGAITARALTVTATGVNKVYDGGMITTVTLSDDRISGDVFTDSYASATFADKNVGPGKAISVTGISISGTDSGNYTFNTTASTSANITARALTVSATGINKVYDGTTAATVTLPDNRVSGDVFSDGYASANFSDKDADTGKTVTVTGISITGTDAGNYTFNTTAITTADITPRVLTVTAHGINKIYDGTTTATFTLTDDRVAGDTVVPNINSANFSDRNVGPGKTVTVILSSSIGGQDHKDYVLASTTLTTTADITSRALTVTAVTNTKIYDGGTAAAAIPTVSGLQDADTANFTEAYTDRNVGTGKTLKASGTVTDSLTHVASLNYTISFVDNGAGVISTRALTITAASNTKGYDGTTSAAATPTVSGLQASDSVMGLIETYDTKNVGTGKILTVSAGYTVSDGNSGLNYAVSLAPNNTGVITTATLTITADPQTKVYGSTDPSLTYVADGLQSGDSSAILTGGLTRASGEHVSGSPYGITQGTLAANANYTIAFAGNSFAITPAALTITANHQTKVYGSSDPTLTYGSSGFQFTDSAASVLTGALTRAAGESVAGGPYAITQGTLAASSDYTIGFTGSTLDITRASLTVTADDKNKVFGAAEPTLTFTLSGTLYYGDTYSVITGVSLSTATGAAATAGMHVITVTGGMSANYDVVAVNGTLTVDKASGLTIKADNQTKVYGGADPMLTFTPSGTLYYGDTYSVITGVSLSTDTGAAATAGTHPILATGGAAANYNVTDLNGTLTVSKAAALTVTADNQSKVYGAADPTLTYTPSGTLFYSDTYAVISGVSLTTETGAAATAGTHVIVATGGTAANYEVTDVNGTLTVSKAAALTVTADNQSKVYGAADPSLTYTPSGTLFYGDAYSVITGVSLSTATGGAATAGTHVIVANGGTAANYNVTDLNGTLTVSKAAALTVTTDNQSKVYGAADPILTFTPSGTLFYSDTYAVISGVSLATETGAAATAGTHPIVATGGTAANYEVTDVNGTLTVSKAAALTVTADNQTKVYGAADPSLTYTPSGTLFYGDAYSVITGVSLSTATGAAATAGTHPILATGGTAANYNVTDVNGTLTVSKAAALTVTADNKAKVYGGTDPMLMYTPSGTLYYGDGYSVITGVSLSSATGAAATVGTHPIVATGGAAANYNVTDANGTLTVSKATALTVTADNQSKVYGAPNPILTFTPSGTLYYGDTYAVISAVSLVTDTGAAATAGTHVIVASGGTAANYNVSTANGTLTVIPASTGVTIGSSANPAVVGNMITFTANVADISSGSVGIPTGGVTFKDGAATLGTPTLSALGVATYSTSALSLGSHTITAVYNGDGNFTPSTSNLTQVVLASVNVTFLPPLAGQPVGNKIKVGQVVPHKVDLVNSLGQSVTTGVTVKLKVLGINTIGANTIEQIVEDANGLGTDGTVTCDGILTLVSGHWQFNLDTSNFSDPNTASEPNACYTSTVYVVDNATMLVVGSTTINLETGK